MCDLKDEGGRCFPHKEGTQAVVAMTGHLTDLPQDHIKQTAKELKKEGKSLPTPSEEEVIALAMTNKFTAKYDPRIPEKKRGLFIRKWQKAEKEKPNGGEFHSWKHTMVESVKRYKRTAVTALLGTSILVTSACGMLPNNNNNNPAPTPEVTISAPASPTTSASPEVKPTPTTEASPTISAKIEAERKANGKIREESKSLLKINGISVTDKVIKSPNGEYPQVAVDKNGKYAKFDSSKHTGGLPKGWTKKDASEAQAFGMNFMLQEVVDSPVGGTADQVDAEYTKWKKKNANTFHPETKSDFLSEDAETLVVTRDWQNYGDFATADYNYPYDGVTPRVKSVNMTLNSSQEYRGGIYYDYSGSISMNGQTEKNRNIVETSPANLSYTVLKVDGKFVIAGLANEFSIDTDSITSQFNPKK